MPSAAFHPQALAEYRSGLVWYARQSRRAAEGFERAVSRALANIRSTPDLYPLYDDIHREAILAHYPYSVVYRVLAGDDVLVVALAHASREPGYWQDRR